MAGDYTKSMWTNESWVIRWISGDEVEITDGTIYRRAVMCGGDFEYLLQGACAAFASGKAIARKDLLGSGRCA